MELNLIIALFITSLVLLVAVGLLFLRVIKKSKKVFLVKNTTTPHTEGPQFKEETRKNEIDNLSSEQKIILEEAEAQEQQGNIIKAAQLFESIGAIRKAVDLLELNNQIQLAADVLLRIGKPDRAGIIFARSSMWKEAVSCFVNAKMYAEAAKCAKLSGDLETAALYFEKSNQHAEAGSCYEKRARYREAFKCYNAVNLDQKSYEMIKLHINTCASETLTLNQDEFAVLEKFVMMGEGNKQVIQVLQNEGRIVPLFKNLLKNKMNASAIELYKHTREIIQNQLLKEMRENDGQAESLLEFLQQLNDQYLLGTALQKLKRFKAAGIAFENAGKHDIALNCYKQAKENEHVIRITQVISNYKMPNIVQLNPKNTPDFTTQESELEELFNRAEFWQGLSNKQLNTIWNAGQIKKFSAGTKILNDSQWHDVIVTVLQGNIECCNQKNEYLRKYEKGSVIGEQSIVEPTPKKLSFHTTSDVVLHFIKTSSLQSLMDKDGVLARRLYQAILKGQREYKIAN